MLELGSLVAESEVGSGTVTADAVLSQAAQEASAGSAGGSLVVVRREAFDIVSRFRVNSANASHKLTTGSLDMSSSISRPEMSLDWR